MKPNKNHADAILALINVGAGSSRTSNTLTKADQIGRMLSAKARELEIPLVTYAEQTSLNNGMHLLSFGDHILANEVSILGNYGRQTNHYYLKDFIGEWHLRAEIVHHGENKVRFNPLLPYKQADADWMRQLTSLHMTFMLDHLCERRKGKLEDEAGTRRYLEEGSFMFGPEAAKRGIIDAVTTPDSFFQDFFKGEAYSISVHEPSLFDEINALKGRSKSQALLAHGIDLAI